MYRIRRIADTRLEKCSLPWPKSNIIRKERKNDGNSICLKKISIKITWNNNKVQLKHFVGWNSWDLYDGFCWIIWLSYWILRLNLYATVCKSIQWTCTKWTSKTELNKNYHKTPRVSNGHFFVSAASITKNGSVVNEKWRLQCYTNTWFCQVRDIFLWWASAISIRHCRLENTGSI